MSKRGGISFGRSTHHSIALLVSITIDLKSYCSLYAPMQYKSSSDELMNIAWCAGPIAIDILHYYT
jgi:hypothetical protein